MTTNEAQEMEILDPTTQPRAVTRSLAQRRADLDGGRIGFLSNKKANADALLREIETLLRARIGDFETLHVHKSAPLPAPEQVLLDLTRCDAIVSAVAD